MLNTKKSAFDGNNCTCMQKLKANHFRNWRSANDSASCKIPVRGILQNAEWLAFNYGSTRLQ